MFKMKVIRAVEGDFPEDGVIFNGLSKLDGAVLDLSDTSMIINYKEMLVLASPLSLYEEDPWSKTYIGRYFNHVNFRLLVPKNFMIGAGNMFIAIGGMKENSYAVTFDLSKVD